MATPIIISPSQKHTASVIFLHGLGDTGEGWEPVCEQLSSAFGHVKFILPTAPVRPVTLNMGFMMPAWYDIKTLSPDGKEDETGTKQTAQFINSLIDKEVASGVPSNRIVLAGFSQGGAMSLYTGLTNSKKLGGILSLSGYLPLSKTFPAALSEANKDTPLLMCHGDADPVVRYAWGQLSFNSLKEWGLSHTDFKTYAGMPHSACPKEIADITVWLKAVLP
eukprot:TRINITY_DN1250_c0_g1_i1.p1 TRINITY_DN1250_c0_g1~~TRINITY_DN1250_c0_g1_i1.p1  ORF type:complete len:221 (+),score=55.21 TRINITY_DN1250_c0_g1_i1:60-722(+)